MRVEQGTAEIHTCPSQKTVYASRADALQDRKRIRKNRYDDRRLYPYECHLCGQFHLSKEKRQAHLRRMRQWADQDERNAERRRAT